MAKRTISKTLQHTATPATCSAELMRGKEEKEVLAKALEMQMQELARARQADALRSSREIESATLEDMKARKSAEVCRVAVVLQSAALCSSVLQCEDMNQSS